VTPSTEELRAAHRELAVALPFDQAMNDTCFRICITNYAEARVRASCRRGRRSASR
jgi:hypothetical protein